MRSAKLQDSLQYLRQTGIPIATVVDVGIQHSTPVLLKVFPDIPHVLFEPIREYYPHIRKNYAGVSYQLIEAAVSDFNGEVLLRTEKKTHGNEISHSYIVKTQSPNSRKVSSITLDRFYTENELEAPILLKIDVEGPDVPSNIIRGAGHLLQRTSAVVIEMTVEKFMERAELLHQADFDMWDITDLCYYGNCLWQADVVFVRREIKQSLMALRPMHERPFRSELWQSCGL